MLYAGVDTHKKYSKVVVTDSTGNRLAEALEENDASISKYKEEIKKPIEPQLLEIVLNWIKSRIA